MWAAHRLGVAAPLQSARLREEQRTEHTGTCELYYTYVNSQLTACIVQYGAVRVVDLLSLAQHKKHYIVYFPHLRVFSTNMETTGFWLLLAAHFILICQQGKACCN